MRCLRCYKVPTNRKDGICSTCAGEVIPTLEDLDDGSSSDDGPTLTTPQREYIDSLINRKDVGIGEVRGRIRKICGRDVMLCSLSVGQASELIEWLKEQ